MRLFVGIALADEVARELTAAVARLRAGESGLRGAAGFRWTEPESWHITLQFLGNTTQDQYECLAARLGDVRSAPVPVELGELGCFDRTGVLFADVVVTPGLAALEQRVITATSQCGFVAEVRPFHPHITLVRAKRQGRGAEMRQLRDKMSRQTAFTRFTAREFLIYESHLGSEGARYEVRARVPLAASARAGYT